MHDEEFFAISGNMCGFAQNLDAAKAEFDKLAGKFIMIAGNIDHFCAFARFAQQLLHHIIVGLRPIPAGAKAPAVDNVADQKNRIGLIHFQKVQNQIRLRGL